jgi:hypothetical protein
MFIIIPSQGGKFDLFVLVKYQVPIDRVEQGTKTSYSNEKVYKVFLLTKYEDIKSVGEIIWEIYGICCPINFPS